MKKILNFLLDGKRLAPVQKVLIRIATYCSILFVLIHSVFPFEHSDTTFGLAELVVMRIVVGIASLVILVFLFPMIANRLLQEFDVIAGSCAKQFVDTGHFSTTATNKLEMLYSAYRAILAGLGVLLIPLISLAFSVVGIVLIFITKQSPFLLK